MSDNADRSAESTSFTSRAENGAYGQNRSAEIYELSERQGTVTTTAAIVESGQDQPVDIKAQRRVQMWAFAALIWSFFMQGWNDGTNGPLLPAMQRNYHVCGDNLSS